MLANRERGSAKPARQPRPHDPASLRSEVLSLLSALGPNLLAASRAVDAAPRRALPALRRAARLLRPYLPA